MINADGEGASPDEVSDKLPLLERIQIRDAVDRRWACVLDTYELTLLGRYLTLTISWGDTHVVTTIRGMMTGNGCFRHAPLKPWAGVSERKLKSARNRLREFGLISTRLVRKNLAEEVTIHPENILCKWEGDVPKITPVADKTPEVGARGTPPSCTPCTTPMQDVHHPHAPRAPHNTSNQHNQEHKQENSRDADAPAISSPAHEKLASVIRDRQRRNISRPEEDQLDELDRQLQPVAKVTGPSAKSKGQRNSTDVLMVWRAAIREAHPAAPAVVAWTIRQKAQVKQVMKAWDDEQGDFFDFIDFVVRQWHAIIGAHFEWMDNPPQFPALHFITSQTKLLPVLMEAYAHHMAMEFVTDHTKSELDRLMASGKTFEQAVEALGERAAKRKLEGVHQRELAALQQELVIAKKNNSGRGHIFGLHNPHPLAHVKKPSPTKLSELQGSDTSDIPDFE